jgi:DtxR family transcriptional regulator, Mn-dependent transcriptional regulator
LHIQRSKLLAQFNKEDICIMTGVVDHTSAFLQYLAKTGLVLGNEIKIKEINEFDKSLQILINKKVILFISNDVAKNILVISK